ncbi:hypothetical protein [Streptomyces sp. NPDC088554]|uniref:hypothetical protein n=1 Tax=Streptomyces sp. NPDC088554 TaxID=3365865 RepID=UPI0038289AEA
MTETVLLLVFIGVGILGLALLVLLSLLIALTFQAVWWLAAQGVHAVRAWWRGPVRTVQSPAAARVLMACDTTVCAYTSTPLAPDSEGRWVCLTLGCGQTVTPP